MSSSSGGTPTSTSTTTGYPILNPNIFLNYIPPATARQFENARNLYLATLGALMWDMLCTLPEDVRLLKHGFRITLVAYFTSRLSALAYVLLSVVVKTHAVSHCTAYEYGVTTCWVVASASGAFLFFQRVKAVYIDQKTVHCVFFLLFIANVAVSLLVPLGSHLGPLADTGHCVNTGIKRYISGAVFSRLVYDSCVFLAISLKFASCHGEFGEPMSWRTLFSRKPSSRIVRAILKGGQQYYLMSVCANLLVSILIVTPSVPPIYEAMFTVPDIALSSSMACHVFRNLQITARTDTAMSGVIFRKSVTLGLGGGGSSQSQTSSNRRSGGGDGLEQLGADAEHELGQNSSTGKT